jgi:ribosomal peptide maturation radical SAM protein 1
MGFRTKSVGKVVKEFSYFIERYNINRFTAVDNILGPKLMEGLVERLAGGEYDYELFYELKANLTRDKVRNLYNSGIRHIQPGIESLNTHVLKLMRKGITAIQNVNALRWMNYYGLEVLWNIIYGFPGETEADYERQRQIIALITHLAPPINVNRIWLERFSPIYNESATFGFADIRPESSYAYVYPRSVDLDKASYFFEGHSPDTISDSAMESTRAAVDRWRSKWEMDRLPFLTFVKTHAGIHICDGREKPDNPINISYRSPADAIYLYCSDQPRAAHSIALNLRDSFGINLDDSSLEAILDRFVSRGFMLAEDNLYLSLGLPAYRRA